MSIGVSTVRPSLTPVRDAIRPPRRTRLTLLLTSGLINVLTLTGSLFMMQVYDRVLGSQSLTTLIGLSAIALFAYGLQGLLESMRTRILVLISEKFDAEIGPKVNAANLAQSIRSPTGLQDAQRNARHVESIRAFLSGPGPLAALDMPWFPIYLITAFVLHWSLALTLVVATLLLVFLTFMTERNGAAPSRAAQEAHGQRTLDAEATLRNAEAAIANGMRGPLLARWNALHEKFLLAQRSATFTIGGYTVAARTSRMVLQSLMLGLGAFLAIKGLISPGAIIAASILSARALAPIDQAIASWKPFMAAREANTALNALLVRTHTQNVTHELDAPTQSLTVSDLTVTVPVVANAMKSGAMAERLVLSGIKFQLKAGEIVGVIGPSASGKSTLGRTLVGLWRARQGTVKIDSAPLEQWSQDRLGKFIGYLPQDVQLFDGTIGQNIARFQEDATDQKIMEAARAAGLHSDVLAIGGYDRVVGLGGMQLSGGQRQRIGLARALYDNPFLIVLDEPNSNLDIDGEIALAQALQGVKARGGIAVVIAHNLRVLDVVDYILLLDKSGSQRVFDLRDKVLEKIGMKVASAPTVAKAGEAIRARSTATVIDSVTGNHMASSVKRDGAPTDSRSATQRWQLQGPRVVVGDPSRSKSEGDK